MDATFHEHGENKGSILQIKCIYSLEKAGLLKENPKLLSFLEEYFNEHFSDLESSNLITIANIFAKNHLTSQRYFELMEKFYVFRGAVV